MCRNLGRDVESSWVTGSPPSAPRHPRVRRTQGPCRSGRGVTASLRLHPPVCSDPSLPPIPCQVYVASTFSLPASYPETPSQGSPVTSCGDRPLRVMHAQGSLLLGAGPTHILAPLASLCDLECVCVCVCGTGRLLVCRARRREGHVTLMVPAGPASPAAALPNQEAALSSSPRSPLGTHASLPWVWLCLEGRSRPMSHRGPPAPAASVGGLSTLGPSGSDATEHRVSQPGGSQSAPPFSRAPRLV